jgi:hypothetical protein
MRRMNVHVHFSEARVQTCIFHMGLIRDRVRSVKIKN